MRSQMKTLRALDLILFNTETIAQQHSQELKKQQTQALE